MNEQFPAWLLALIPGLPLIGAFCNLLGSQLWSRKFVHAVAVGSVAAACGVTFYCIWQGVYPGFAEYRASLGEKGVADGQFVGIAYTLFTWIEVDQLKLELAFRMDTLSAIMCLVITFVGTLIHIYSTGYMAKEPRYAAYFGYLNLFMGAMLVLVLGDNLPVLFIGWEGVGLCSYLLIGFWFQNSAFANAGRKAFVVNRIGDFCFLLGICLIFWVTAKAGAPTLDFPALKASPALSAMKQNMGWLNGERAAALAGVLLFLGACGKSAQIPLYVWLPDAMAGPTPVSALIHAATMVTAGIYMVARLSFLFAMSATAMAVVAGIGALTAILAAYMAFAQTDLKKVLAYSTVSQLGFMFVAVGCGAWAAGIFHLVTHAFFKAGLFLGAGSVMHAMSGSGDIMKMGGLKKYIPITRWTFAVYCWAISGLPLLSGFFSKDEILAGAFAARVADWPPFYGYCLWGILSLAALGTSFYMYRIYYLIFHGECRADETAKAHIHESPRSMWGPLVVLAGATCFLGFLGLPHLQALHLPNFFHEWLAPVMAPLWLVAGKSSATAELPQVLDGTLLALMVVATALAVIGWIAARSLYQNGPSLLAQRFAASQTGSRFYKLAKNKLYVDELYELVIVKPFRKICRVLFLAADQVVIDTFFVGGAAALVEIGGTITRWLHNGQVQRYLVMVVAGGAMVLIYASSSTLDFEYEVLEEGRVRLQAHTGAGVSAAKAQVSWDIDGDGRPESTKKEMEWDFGGPGQYSVTVSMEDGVFGGKTTKTKLIVIPSAAETGASSRAEESKE